MALAASGIRANALPGPSTPRKRRRAPLVAAIALALLDHRLGLRPSIGSERAADFDLFGGELALVAANVAFGTRMGLNQLAWHPNLHPFRQHE